MRLTGLSVLILLAALATVSSGCGTVARAKRTVIYGDAGLREKVKKIAVVGCLGMFKLKSNESEKSAFAEYADKQNVVEYQYREILDDLWDSYQFQPIPHEKVAGSRFYHEMAVNGRKEKLNIYGATCPKGLREIKPEDDFDFEGLCDDLGADAVLMFTCSYKWKDHGAHYREGFIISAACTVRDRDGNVLYEQRDLNQPSGPRYFWSRFLFGSGIWTDVTLINAATAIFVEDFIYVFEGRENPNLEPVKLPGMDME